MRVENLEMSFGNRTLFKNISFSLNHGIVQLIGKSGCGKTTFLRILLGKIKPIKGTINFEAEAPITSYAGTDDSLLGSLSFKENHKIILGSKYSDRTEYLIDLFSFSECIDKPLLELSGGEKKKAELIIALSKEADLYCLDEPFQGIDEDTRRKLFDYLNEFSKDHLIVMANHYETESLIESVIDIEFVDGGIVRTKTNDLEKSRINNHKSKHDINSFFVQLRTLTRFSKRNIILMISMVFISFLGFYLGCAFTNTKSEDESLLLSLEENSFNRYSLTYNNNTEEVSPDYTMLSNDIDMMSVALDDHIVQIVFIKDLNSIYRCSSYSDTQSKLNIDSTEYTVDNIGLDDSILKTVDEIYDIQYSLKVTKEYDIIIAGFDIRDKILSSKSTDIDGYRIFSQLRLYDSRNRYQLTFDTGDDITIDILNTKSLGIPDVSPGSSVKIEAGKTFMLSTDTNTSTPTIGIDLIRLMLMTKEKIPSISFYQSYVDKDTARTFIQNDHVEIRNLIYDYSKDNVLSKIFFAISGIITTSLAILSFFISKGIEKWKTNIDNFYFYNQISSKKKHFDSLMTALMISFPQALLLTLCYLTFFIPLSNLIMKDVFIGGRSIINTSYSLRYCKPIPFLTLNTISILSIVLLIIIFLALSLMLFYRKKNKHKQ